MGVRELVCAGFAVVALGLVLPTDSTAQTLRGAVLYNGDDTPVVLASVRLIDADGATVSVELTDPDGFFELAVPATGPYTIHIDHLSILPVAEGPVELDASETIDVILRVALRPIELAGIDVEASRQSTALEVMGFYHRRLATSGFFLGPDDIAERAPVRSRDVLRAVPGLQYVESVSAGAHGFPMMSFAMRRRTYDNRPCLPRIYVDGLVSELGGPGYVPLQDFDEIVHPEDLIGVEIYRSPAELPVQFGGLTACGVILLWTKASSNR